MAGPDDVNGVSEAKRFPGQGGQDRGALECLIEGDRAFDAEDLETAILCYTRAIEMDPGNGQAYFNRGLCYRCLGRHEEAISDYDQCLVMDPEDSEARRFDGGEASDHDGLGAPSSTSEHDEGVNEVPIRVELAEAYLNMGDKEEALRILEETMGAAGQDDRQKIIELIRRANS